MKKPTRHEIRECLLQSLYAASVGGSKFEIESFLELYYDERFVEAHKDVYFKEVFAGVIEKELELVAIVTKYAPKFDVAIMPVVNILPIFIAAYEMVFLTSETIPEKASIDEAIELAKKFSDDPARMMVNGVLNSLKNEKEAVVASLPELISGKTRHIFTV